MENKYSSNVVHVLLVPFPSQGHIVPMVKLGNQLVNLGINVTMLTTEFVHSRMENVAPLGSGGHGERMKIISVPDGLPPEDERKDDVKTTTSLLQVMPCHLENLIKNVNAHEQVNSGQKITWMIADSIFGFAVEIAKKMRLKLASLFTSAPGILSMVLSIPRLIETGVLDANDGTVIKNEEIQLSPNLPALNNVDFMWGCPDNGFTQMMVFQYLFQINRNLKASDLVLCNWFRELDPSAEDLHPYLLTIGPLIANDQPCGNLWSEDLTCLSWLDTHTNGSVIYVAFGSTKRFTQHQFDELVLGLELAGRPFLLVVRSDLTNGDAIEYPEGFDERVANFGKMVRWAPQEKVLAHPSIACYLTHCGWNSTIEGISNGVPLICCPYFTDQFYNKSCACYGWKVGLELKPDENGIITRHEVRARVDELLSDEYIKENSLKLKQLAQKSISKGGSSSNNLERFIAELKR